MRIFKDQLLRTIEVKDHPQRILSLVPSQTELLCDLGLEENIVGVTKFCVHPEYLRKTKPIIGGTKQIKIAEIKELQPDIILCNKEENTKEIVEALEKIAPVHVSDIYTIEDSLSLIKSYGTLFNCDDMATKIASQIETNFKDFQNFIKDKPVYGVAYFIWKTPWMVVANKTFIHHLLEINRFKNVFEDAGRYPEVDITTISKDKNPDLILLSSEPYPFNESHVLEVKKHTQNSKVILVDGEYFSWYGSRLIDAFKYFKELHLNL